MPQYTKRLTWPDRPDDYVFKADGQDAGRCYRHYLRFYRDYCWHWTVYGSGFAGDEPTLEAAQAKFKAAYERAGQRRLSPIAHPPTSGFLAGGAILNLNQLFRVFGFWASC